MVKPQEKGNHGLTTTTIESFFPSPKSYFYEYTKTSRNPEGTTPREYIDFLMMVWNTENVNNNVPRLITMGLEKNFDGMPFVIENFDYEYVAGDVDVNYKLSIKQYKPYGAKLVDYDESGTQSARVQSPFLDNTDIQSTYTVQSGDCLWNITKACCGDGSRWKELYNINADVIEGNPNSIKPGQVLTLPDGWDTPTKVEKLKQVNKNNLIKTNESNAATGSSGGGFRGSSMDINSRSDLAEFLQEAVIYAENKEGVSQGAIDHLKMITEDVSMMAEIERLSTTNSIDVSPTTKLKSNMLLNTISAITIASPQPLLTR